MRFLDGHGATVLTYSGLKVWDADGKTLPSRFGTAATGLRLLVDERGARYPITIDPIAQQAYLKAENTGAGDYFGYPVAISGDTAVGAGALNLGFLPANFSESRGVAYGANVFGYNTAGIASERLSAAAGNLADPPLSVANNSWGIPGLGCGSYH